MKDKYTIDTECGGSIVNGDFQSVAGSIEPGSVDLILTDPPYGTVKGAGIDGWDDETTEWDVAINPADIFDVSEQLLRKRGKLVLFSQEPYTSKFITSAETNLPFSYRMTWVKNHFANSLIAKDCPVNFFEDIIVFTKEYDGTQTYPLRDYAKSVMDYIGLTLKKINDVLGHRKAEHFFYIDTTQFELCTRETYRELIAEFGIDEMPGFSPYDQLEEMRAENTFNLPDGKKYKSNVFEYDKPKSNHHPTQKPVPLLEDLITTYTHKGDRVVDLTAGSGSTAVAAVNTERECIAIEKDADYYKTAAERVSRIDDSAVSVRGQSNLEAYADGGES